jgi:hypothetical protein
MLVKHLSIRFGRPGKEALRSFFRTRDMTICSRNGAAGFRKGEREAEWL